MVGHVVWERPWWGPGPGRVLKNWWVLVFWLVEPWVPGAPGTEGPSDSLEAPWPWLGGWTLAETQEMVKRGFGPRLASPQPVGLTAMLELKGTFYSFSSVSCLPTECP